MLQSINYVRNHSGKFIKSELAKSYSYKLRFVGKQSEKFQPNGVFDARLHVEVKL